MNAHTIELSLSPNTNEMVHILHVDDDPNNLALSKEILTMESRFEIETATCVEEAFKKLSTQKYDVIISDYEMPQKNGLDFLKELREQKNAIAFFLFTGKGREEIAVKALNLGADGYYHKQGDIETVYGELIHGVQQVVAQKRMETKLREVLKVSQLKFQTLADESPNIIFINKKGRVVYTNKKAQEVMEYDQEEFYSPNFNFLSLIAPESKQTLASAYSRHMKGQEIPPYEYKLVTKSGKIIEAQINTKLIDYEGDKAILGVITDITERKKTEIELKNAEKNIRQKNEIVNAIINSTDDLIYALDR